MTSPRFWTPSTLPTLWTQWNSTNKHKMKTQWENINLDKTFNCIRTAASMPFPRSSWVTLLKWLWTATLRWRGSLRTLRVNSGQSHQKFLSLRILSPRNLNCFNFRWFLGGVSSS
jgi:hypothetical protein